MKRFISVILLAALFTVAYGADEGGTGADSADGGDKPGEQTQQQPAQKEKKISETFIPSEEISEDLSVPFPVDI